MKKYIYTLLVLTAYFALSTPAVLAQTETEATTTETTTAETGVQPETTTLRERIVEKGLSALKQNRIVNLAANISNMIDARISRLDTIAHRLERRIAKMEQAGLDVAAAKSKVAEAHTELDFAMSVMANIDSSVKAVSTSEKPKEAWLFVKGTFVEAHASIKEVKGLLKESIMLLREAKPVASSDETASSSEPTTATE